MNNGNAREITAEKRRNKIIDIITRDGKVKVSQLSNLFNISEVTIRNDLSELEADGVLERTHGGAISTSKAYFNMSFHERMKTNKQEKMKIAETAANMVNDGDYIMFNSGTTTLYTAQKLRNNKNLVIVTNAISIAHEISHFNGVQIILLGGNYNPKYQFTYGDDTINGLKKYKVDKLILSVDGISAKDGITTFLHLESEINRQMIKRVNKVIAVADHTKINRVSFAYIDKVNVIDTLITDTKADKEHIEILKEKGIEVIVV
ncbi:MAG: DeoR/GlpR family DNA-binding transcription regulator [Clostridia bacterium]|nr:DeoR/GlpR family DNA-binding transcription regulator [Clostridia bacterium]